MAASTANDDVHTWLLRGPQLHGHWIVGNAANQRPKIGNLRLVATLLFVPLGRDRGNSSFAIRRGVSFLFQSVELVGDVSLALGEFQRKVLQPALFLFEPVLFGL